MNNKQSVNLRVGKEVYEHLKMILQSEGETVSGWFEKCAISYINNK